LHPLTQPDDNRLKAPVNTESSVSYRQMQHVGAEGAA
jgi:hypothetical protein